MGSPFDFPRAGRQREDEVDAGIAAPAPDADVFDFPVAGRAAPTASPAAPRRPQSAARDAGSLSPPDAGVPAAPAPEAAAFDLPHAGNRGPADPRPKPPPVAEQDVLDELLGGVTAFGQGVGFNVIDDAYEAVGGTTGADYIRDTTKQHPNSHLAGTMLRSGIAAAAAPATMGAQALAAGLTGAAGEFGESASLLGAGAVGLADAAMGATFQAGGELLGAGAKWARGKLPAWLGGGDDIERAWRAKQRGEPRVSGMPRLPSEPAPQRLPAPAAAAEDDIILELAEPRPPMADPADVRMLNDVPVPEAGPPRPPELVPPGDWPPAIGTPKLVQGKGGRFAKPIPMELEGPIGPRRPRGLDAPSEPPPLTPEEMLLSEGGPRADDALQPVASMSEPPLPMDPPPPSRPSYSMGELEPTGAPRMLSDYPPPLTGEARPGKAYQFLRNMAPRPVRAAMDLYKPMTGAPSPVLNAWPEAATAARVGLTAAYQPARDAARDFVASRFTDRASAQDRAPAQDERVAYASPATTNYALSAVLSSGQSGLSPEDEAALTHAVVQGDEQAMRAADFRLRMANPAYARAIERELRSYNEGDY